MLNIILAHCSVLIYWSLNILACFKNKILHRYFKEVIWKLNYTKLYYMKYGNICSEALHVRLLLFSAAVKPPQTWQLMCDPLMQSPACRGFTPRPKLNACTLPPPPRRQKEDTLYIYTPASVATVQNCPLALVCCLIPSLNTAPSGGNCSHLFGRILNKKFRYIYI